MMASRGMGAMNPSKMPKGKKTARRDDTDFTQYREGGEVTKPKSKGEEFMEAEKFLQAQQSSTSGIRRSDADKKRESELSKKAKDALNAYQAEKNATENQKQYGMKKGGKVNAAGNYTKPGMRKSMFESIKARAVQGTGAGQWSARKAQLLAKNYKAKGGGYKD